MARVVNYVGAAIAGVAFFRMAPRGIVELLGALPFLVWVLPPFLLTHAALKWRPDSMGRAVATTLVNLLIALPYFDLILPSGRETSTAGLAFLFVPLWHLFGVIIVIALTQWRLPLPSVPLPWTGARCPFCKRALPEGATNCKGCTVG